MRTTAYNAFHNNTTTASNLGTVTVIRPGRLIGMKMSASMSGGAAFGHYVQTAYLNDTSDTLWSNTTNPNRLSGLGSLRMATVVTTATDHDSGYVPLNIPVVAGDRLSLSLVLAAGTAATGTYMNCVFYVQES